MNTTRPRRMDQNIDIAYLERDMWPRGPLRHSTYLWHKMLIRVSACKCIVLDLLLFLLCHNQIPRKQGIPPVYLLNAVPIHLCFIKLSTRFQVWEKIRSLSDV